MREKSLVLGGLALILLLGASTAVLLSQAGEEVEEKEAEDPELAKLVAEATADLAERRKVEPDEIEVERAEWVVWRNSALGCPEQGRMYLQALQDGALIELRAKKKTYRYHSDVEGPPAYCAKPSSKDPLPREKGAE